ncbi:MAG: right-handed parallel beta-helix repeat-containing protein [Planctomycetota bacterium]|jgi:hypothetical protein
MTLLRVLVVASVLAAAVRAEEEPAAAPVSWQPQLGLFYVVAPASLAADLEAKPKSVVVTGVVAGSAADQAGVKRGDLVVRCDVWREPDRKGRIRIARGGEERVLEIASRQHDLTGARLRDGDARPEPRTLTVDPKGAGAARTLTAALLRALPGDRVVVSPGTYREELLLPSGVTVGAAKAGTVRIVAKTPCRIVGAHDTTLAHLTLRGIARAVSIWDSRAVVLERCDLAAEQGDAVRAHRTQALALQSCRLHGGPEAAGLALHRSGAEIGRSLAYGCATGLEVADGSTLEARDNLLDGNTDGVTVLESTLEASGNTLTGGDQGSGISLTRSTATLRDNALRHFKMGVYGSQATATLAGNTLSQHDFAVSLSGGRVQIVRNLIYGNRIAGVVLVAGESGPDQAGAASVLHNTVRANRGLGLLAMGMPVTIRFNVVDDNGQGIVIKGAAAELRNNTIVLQKAQGVLIQAGAKVTAHNNIVAYNGTGIAMDATASLEAGHNNVHANLAHKTFPLVDGNYARQDRVWARNGDRFPVWVFPADDLRSDTDLNRPPGFVALGRDYRLKPDSPLAGRRGADGAFIGALPVRAAD